MTGEVILGGACSLAVKASYTVRATCCVFCKGLQALHVHVLVIINDSFAVKFYFMYGFYCSFYQGQNH